MPAIRTLLAAVLGGLLAVAALAPGHPAHAQAGPPRDGQLQGMMAAFGMVGIVSGQTARLSAVLGNPPDDGEPSCQVDLAILGADGNRLGGGQGTIRAGGVAHVDFVAPAGGRSRPGPAAPDRIMLRAVAKAGVGPSPFGPDPSPFAPCGAPLLASLEIFDSRTQQTSVVLHPAVLVGFNPQPDPPMPEVR